jgi:hypothetical protein
MVILRKSMHPPQIRVAPPPEGERPHAVLSGEEPPGMDPIPVVPGRRYNLPLSWRKGALKMERTGVTRYINI